MSQRSQFFKAVAISMAIVLLPLIMTGIFVDFWYPGISYSSDDGIYIRGAFILVFYVSGYFAFSRLDKFLFFDEQKDTLVKIEKTVRLSPQESSITTGKSA